MDCLEAFLIKLCSSIFHPYFMALVFFFFVWVHVFKVKPTFFLFLFLCIWKFQFGCGSFMPMTLCFFFHVKICNPFLTSNFTIKNQTINIYIYIYMWFTRREWLTYLILFIKSWEQLFFGWNFSVGPFFQNHNILSKKNFKKKSLLHIFFKNNAQKKLFKKIHVSTHYFKHIAKI